MASSMLGKSKVTIDLTVLDNGDSIAAYLTSASGSLITSTTIGAKAHEDVLDPSSHLQGTVYAAGTDWLSSMGVVDSNGDWVPLTLNANGELPVSATVDAAGDYATGSVHGVTDVGIYGLTVRRDTRAVDAGVADGDYASFSVNAIGELWVHDADALAQLLLANSSLDAIETSNASILAELLDQGATLDSILADTATIDSQTLSIQNTLLGLSKAEDAAHVSGDAGIQALAVRQDTQGSAAANGDYTSIQTWSEGSVKVVDVANGAILQQRVTVGATATAIPAAPLANRKSLTIQNAGNASVWVGTSTVTTSGATAGIEIPKGGFLELEVGPAVTVSAIRGANAIDVNVLETA